MNRSWRMLLLWSVGFLLLQAVGYAQQKGGKKPERSMPPRFTNDELKLFSTDAREKLKGERPALGGGGGAKKQPGTIAKVEGEATAPSQGDAPAAGGGFAWSKLIAPEVLEDEVKAHKLLVDTSVTTPGPFKGGTNRDARKEFTTLAVLFAIIAEYDGQVRWQKEAPCLRDLFAQAGFSCKVGTDQSYNQSKLRQQDLADLVGGSTPASVKEVDPKNVWDKVANRSPLMQRMEEGFDKRLQPWLANEGSFKENSEKILHEAQLLAAIAEVIQREGFEFTDDETYLGFAKAMREGALGIVEGVKTKNYSGANAAAGNVSKACSSCHEGYRS